MTIQVYRIAPTPSLRETNNNVTARQKNKVAWSLGNELHPIRSFGSNANGSRKWSDGFSHGRCRKGNIIAKARAINTPIRERMIPNIRIFLSSSVRFLRSNQTHQKMVMATPPLNRYFSETRAMMRSKNDERCANWFKKWMMLKSNEFKRLYLISYRDKLTRSKSSKFCLLVHQQ